MARDLIASEHVVDEAILRAINAWAEGSAGAEVGIFLSSIWVPILTFVPFGIFLFVKRRLVPILAITLALVASDAVNARIVKPLAGRERPCRALSDLHLPKPCGSGKSFASGHAALAAAFLLSAAPAARFGWAIFLPLAVLVSGSRVLLGAHYPSDILGGWAIGAVFGALAWALWARLEARLAVRIGQKTQPSSP